MSRRTYLYRAVTLEHLIDEFTGDTVFWPGDTLGRATGYLSRSAAVDAGRRSGARFEVVRSEPVVFPVPHAVEVRELRDQIAALKFRLSQGI